ncbi:MAG TPA: hypothetical protein VMT30_07780 [Candidatus Saccharimonadia bacterium]|nr:hypothetical protein [Candidatus Saccharimonadia bacterium]
MVTLIHVIIALASLGFTTFVFFSPSRTKLHASYGLAALTITSGVYLTFTKPAHLLETCTIGLLYVGLVSAGIIASRHKLTSTTSTD